MGSSQSQPNGHLKRYSRVASDQLKSVLRRGGRSTQENTGDEKARQAAGTEQETTNDDHDDVPAAPVSFLLHYLWLCLI